MPEKTTRAISELARSCHTTVNTVLQGAFAQLLMWLTGHHDVAFGAVVSGRPAEVTGTDSMVGLLINTVPVRANFTAATTTAELLDQLQSTHNRTLEHQHLALSDIHRITNQERLFDTVFVYENYPIGTAAALGDDGLTITDINTRDYYHYALTIQASPGAELNLRLQFRTDVFDLTRIEALVELLQRVLVTMTTEPTRRLSLIDRVDAGQPARPDASSGELETCALPAPKDQDADGDSAPATLTEQIVAGIYVQVLGRERVGVDDTFFDLGGDSLSAMRLVAAINSSLAANLVVRTVFESPSVRSLSQQLGRQASSAELVSATSQGSDVQDDADDIQAE